MALQEAGVKDSSVMCYESVIRGHHVYKRTWNPRIGEMLTVHPEHGNTHDRHAVSVVKDGIIVGHVQRELARYFCFFMVHSGRITCEVTGRRKKGNGLEVPCVYTFSSAIEKAIVKLTNLLRNNVNTICEDIYIPPYNTTH